VTENEGGRAKRRLSLCFASRVYSEPIRFLQLASFSSLVLYVLPCFLTSFTQSHPTFLSMLMCFHGLPRIVHLGFSPDSPGPRPTAWHILHSHVPSVPMFAQPPPAKPLMHASLITLVAFKCSLASPYSPSLSVHLCLSRSIPHKPHTAPPVRSTVDTSFVL